jgi:hypothetical protein
MRRYLIAASLLATSAISVLAPQVAAAQDRCEQIRHDNQVTGTVAGAVGGAILGGLVAGNRGHQDSGALLGALAGGVVGNQIAGAQNPCPDGYQRVDEPTWGLHQREAGIERRVSGGVESGRIGRREAGHALDRLNQIRAEEGDMRSHNGGRLFERDRAMLWGQLDDLERSIVWRDVAPPPPPPAPPPPPPPVYDEWREAPHGLREREAWIEQRIHDRVADGRLTRDDARPLGDHLRWIRDQEHRLAQDHGGLTPVDEHNLQEQLDNLTQELRQATLGPR